MLETLRQKLLKKSLVNAAILIIIGIVMIIFTAKYALGAIMGYSRLEDLKPDEIKNQLIEIDLEVVASFYSSQDINANYYNALVETRDGEYFLSLKVGNYSQIRSAIYDVYKNGGPSVTLYGKIQKMNDQEQSAFERSVNKVMSEVFGISSFRMSEVAISPYRLTIFENKAAYDGIGGFLCAVGLLLIVIAIINICRAATGSSLKKLKSDFAAAGFTEEMATADYNASVSFTKKDTLRVGRQFVYYLKGYVPRAIPATNLVWTYQTTTTHRRNGVKVNTTYSILFYLHGESGPLTLQMPNEASVKDALQEISLRFPWVVVGYTDELKRMYNKNRAEFLNLRFNTVEHVPVDPGYTNINV